MIRSITKPELPACLRVFHLGYETVAAEFGLTEENCPDRGRASLPLEKLTAAFDAGTDMYGYFAGDEIVGYLGMRIESGFFKKICKLDDIVVLPEYRGNGYGKTLLDFCKAKAREAGADKIKLGMINDNKQLRQWYEDNGFVNAGYKKYEGAPFTVGHMECRL